MGPVLIFSAFGLLASLQSNTLVQHLLELEPFGTLLVWSGEMVPFLMLCIVFTFFYKMIPNTHVQIGSAAIGGVSAAILWIIVGEAFAKFVAASANYSAIYSSFAVLMLFLLWLYTGWIIVLIGAQFSFFHQYPTAYLSRLLWEQGTHLFREQLALKVLMVLGHHYLKGDRPLRLSELASELNMPLSLVEEEVGRLVENGFVGRLQEVAQYFSSHLCSSLFRNQGSLPSSSPLYRKGSPQSAPRSLLVRVPRELVSEGLRETHGAVGEFLPMLP